MIQQGAIRLGVVTNPEARRNRTDHALSQALRANPDIPCITYRGEADLAAGLAEMARAGITDLVVDGGDGTVVAAVSAALHVDEFATLPRITIVPSGMTNLIAAEIGATAPREQVIDRLLGASAASLDAATVKHAPMRIARGDGLPLLHGFLLGAAAFHRGTLLSWERVHPLGATQQAAAGLGILANIWRAAFGADRKTFLAGDPIRVAVDGAPLPGEQRFLLLLSTLFIPLFVRAVRIPYSILMPLIVVFCVTGAYSLKNNVWDVGMMLVFGVIGYLMKKLGYSPAALVLALVLGPLAERALRQSLIISDAGIAILFLRPISATLTLLALAAIAVPVVRAFLRRAGT